MKKIYLIFMPVLLFSQHFTETFDDFRLSSDASTYSMWDAYNQNIKTDQVGSNDLTFGGGLENYTQASVLYNSGYEANLSPNRYIEKSDNASLEFNTGFTIEILLKTPATIGTLKGLVTKDALTANRSYSLYLQTDNKIYFAVDDDGSAPMDANRPSAATVAAATYYSVVATFDASNQHIYINGSLSDGTLTGTTPATYYDGTAGFRIGAFTNDYFFGGTVAQCRLSNKVRTATEIAKSFFLASGWVSKQGEVTRTNWAFAQGINGTGLSVKLGTGEYVSQSLSASNTSYTLNLGTQNLSSDSIFIATDTDTISHAVSDYTVTEGLHWSLTLTANETGGVVTVDNLSLSEASASTQDKGFKEHSKFPRFKSLK